jgi:putative AlgH/UPF0301 family transcriptional regulator
MNLATLFEKIDVPFESGRWPSLPVFFGGPVQTDRGFVLHRPLGELAIDPGCQSKEIGLTSSRDVLQPWRVTAIRGKSWSLSVIPGGAPGSSSMNWRRTPG